MTLPRLVLALISKKIFYFKKPIPVFWDGFFYIPPLLTATLILLTAIPPIVLANRVYKLLE